MRNPSKRDQDEGLLLAESAAGTTPILLSLLGIGCRRVPMGVGTTYLPIGAPVVSAGSCGPRGMGWRTLQTRTAPGRRIWGGARSPRANQAMCHRVCDKMAAKGSYTKSQHIKCTRFCDGIR